jgi:hypothetical protein
VITLENNLKKSIIDVKVGDVVKAVDSNGNLINSEVVSIMHKNSNEFGDFLIFTILFIFTFQFIFKLNSTI